jgi:hypothetical protein
MASAPGECEFLQHVRLNKSKEFLSESCNIWSQIKYSRLNVPRTSANPRSGEKQKKIVRLIVFANANNFMSKSYLYLVVTLRYGSLFPFAYPKSALELFLIVAQDGLHEMKELQHALLPGQVDTLLEVLLN